VRDELAARRARLHQGHASSRPLSEGHEHVGLAGERHFASLTGLPLDESDRIAGDGGIDFILPLGIDVKTARKPHFLIVEEGKVRADIYVLAAYRDDYDATSLIGWAWGNDVRRAPIREFTPGIRSHAIPAAELRDPASIIALARGGVRRAA
jgi:hypothetical protein